MEHYADTAAAISMASYGASFAINALPDDWGSALASEIAEAGDALFIVTCMIYLEKYMLTIFGYVSFTWIVPISMGLIACHILTGQRALKNLAIKLLVSALLLMMLVPVSVKLSQLIEVTHGEEINMAIEEVTRVTKEVEGITEELEAAESADTPVSDAQEKKADNPLQQAGQWISDTADSIGKSVSDGAQSIGTFFSGAADTVLNGAEKLIAQFKQTLHSLVNAISILVINMVVVPILTWMALAVLLKVFWHAELPTYEAIRKSLGSGRKRFAKKLSEPTEE